MISSLKHSKRNVPSFLVSNTLQQLLWIDLCGYLANYVMRGIVFFRHTVYYGSWPAAILRLPQHLQVSDMLQ